MRESRGSARTGMVLLGESGHGMAGVERYPIRDDGVAHYLDDHPGMPLGVGMPSGRPLRQEFFHKPSQTWRGESHLQWWERITRGDPCSFCGEPGGTVDHIEPKTLPVRGLGGAHSWLNLTGACERCNGRKARKSLLTFMVQRRYTWR